MKYTTWLKTAAVFQLLTAFIHGISLFTDLTPSNETERQMIELMDTYKLDLGIGFHPTMANLFMALSACFSLVCLLGGLINWYLVKKEVSADTMRGVITINLVVFTILFGLNAALTFLPPIVLTGLIFLFLVLARITVANKKGEAS